MQRMQLLCQPLVIASPVIMPESDAGATLPDLPDQTLESRLLPGLWLCLFQHFGDGQPATASGGRFFI